MLKIDRIVIPIGENTRLEALQKQFAAHAPEKNQLS